MKDFLTQFKFLFRSGFLGGPVPPLYVSFPCVVPWVRVRKLAEPELTMTMNMNMSRPLKTVLMCWGPGRNW